MTHVTDGSKVFEDWVTVLATLPALPLPLNSQRVAFETERLIIRPPVEEDLAALHELRTQPEVMANTRRGLLDDDLEFTRDRLTPFLPPGDAKTYNCVICLREAGDNKLVGMGGVHNFTGGFGWPELGYMFRKECWGKGYATEFVRGFLQLYSALPRTSTPVPVRVARASLPPELAAKAGPGSKEMVDESSNSPAALASTVTADTVVVEEILMAIIADYNKGSLGVAGKAGFEKVFQFSEEDNRKPGTGIQIFVHFLQYFPGRKTLSTVEA
ncbi:hypothetical protein SPBR_00944 [Sporothrix brasiliensis 5110]|uniref:N-acetyltransferase domain-containing protein n=1 Tax=Sporothrix brasiliensis 5110 TaxID=1398154 RepID=A0A0C2ILT7_9PEZI|nr:uncharacterized protein SPBR_00944 [Sporothrix brasiliensis 5110]KIH90051.1 hypothetical protein SPBR_00944 [Sporothrix brasiliensis 5110]